MDLRIYSMASRKHGPTEFGERMVSLRKARGLTQIELAKVMNSTQRAISYYENETDYPPTSALIEISKALRVTADELLGLKARQPGPLEADPKLRRMWKKFQQVVALPERDQRAVIRLVNSLASVQRADG